MQATISPQGISGIAAGYLTDTTIYRPSSAEAGALIDVEIAVTNISAETLAITLTGVVEEIQTGAQSSLYPSPDYIWIEPGGTGSFTTSFIMPPSDVRLWIVTWYWDGTQFIQDLVVYVDIALIEVPADRTRIVEIIAPTSANAGDVVNLEVKVINLISQSFYIGVSGLYDDTVLSFSPDFVWLAPATIESFTASFTMPDKDFHGLIASNYWTGTEWIRDDFTYLDIALVTVPPVEYEGTISKKQLTYDSVVGNIPVTATVSQGTSGTVAVWGRNDMATTQQMGIIWRVFDPDGVEVDYYSRWEEWPYNPPGGEHNFDPGHYFDLDKPGVWTIELALYMNLDDPVIVDSYMGTLCTVEAIEYAGVITEVWINKDPEGTELSPDTTVVADGNTFEVGTRARNDSSVTFTGTVQVVVYDPDNVKRVDKSDSTGIDPGEELYFGEGLGRTFNICSVDKAGDWIIVVTFRGNGTLLDHKEYIMTATPAPPEVEFREGSFVITGYDGVPVDEQLMVIPGQTVTFHMTVDYRGPAIDGSIYTAIGWKGIYFLPTFSSKIPIHLDASFDFATYEFDCDVDIKTLDPLEELAYGTILDVYAKIVEVPGSDIYTPFYIGVIAWGKPPEEYELIQHTFSHFAYIYEGDAETTIVTLKASPFNPADWVPEELVAELEREARESGVRVLETKVYVDTSPLLWTDFRIEVIGTPSGEVTAAGIGVGAIPLWVKIIQVALALAFALWIIGWVVEQIVGIFNRKPGLEDMKPSWGKEALILDIQDSEEHYERTPTPEETLQGMSEEELRDTLDQIAEEEVLPEVEFPLGLVIVGGLGVLGIGAAIALATRRKT